MGYARYGIPSLSIWAAHLFGSSISSSRVDTLRVGIDLQALLRHLGIL